MSCAVQRPDSAGETRAESTASTVARGEEAGGSKYIRTGLHSARCCGDVREQSLARGHSLQRRFHTCARETCSLLVISRNPGRGKHDARLLIDKHLSRLFHRPPAPRREGEVCGMQLPLKAFVRETSGNPGIFSFYWNFFLFLQRCRAQTINTR